MVFQMFIGYKKDIFAVLCMDVNSHKRILIHSLTLISVIFAHHTKEDKSHEDISETTFIDVS